MGENDLPSPGGKSNDIWILSNNPWVKVNRAFKDQSIAVKYKRALTVSFFVVVLCVFGVALSQVGGFFNFAGLLHLLPIFLPWCCGRGLGAFLWAFISVISIISSIVSMVTGTIAGTILPALILNGLIILCELLNISILTQIDPHVKEKLLVCFKDCSCCLREEQVQQRQEAIAAKLQAVSPFDDPENNTVPVHYTETAAQIEDAEVATEKGTLGIGAGFITNKPRSKTPNNYRTPFETQGSITDGESMPADDRFGNPSNKESVSRGAPSFVSASQNSRSDGRPSGGKNYDTIKSLGAGIGASVMSAITNFNDALEKSKQATRAADKANKDIESLKQQVKGRRSRGKSAADNYHIDREEKELKDRLHRNTDAEFEGENEGGKRVILRKEAKTLTSGGTLFKFKHKADQDKDI